MDYYQIRQEFANFVGSLLFNGAELEDMINVLNYTIEVVEYLQSRQED